MDETPKEARESMGRAFLREVFDFVRILILAAVIVIPIRYFIAQPFIVKGASMEPNFQERDYLIIDELTYYFRNPARGEVVVFRYPLEPSEYFIKRVIGLPGETVVIRGGGVYVEKTPDAEPMAVPEAYLPKGLETAPDEEKTLGPDEYFVMGDNRAYSLDSRKWGVLNRSFITGRAIFLAWPLPDAGIIVRPQY